MASFSREWGISSRRPRWWQWPTVLSLDAPAVTLLWQWLLGWIAAVPLPAPRAFVLGASIWLAYSADRWIEGWRLSPERIKTKRHYFYQRWRWPVAAAWLLVLAADLSAAVLGLSRREFAAGSALLGLVLAYLFSHQLVHRHRRWRVPKEVCVAFLLGGGVAVFIVPRATCNQLRPAAAPFLFFLFLCFANCALISVWESAVDRSHGQSSWARQFRWGAGLSRALPWLLAVSALPFWLKAHGPAGAGMACAMSSSVLLGLVERCESRLGRELARVLTDLVLMTPVVPLVAELA